MGGNPMQKTQMSAVDQQKNYKTQLCRHWQKSKYIISKFYWHVFYKFIDGVCNYGNACCYAHGEHELRQPQNHGGSKQKPNQNQMQAPQNMHNMNQMAMSNMG